MAKQFLILALLLLSCCGCATYHKEIDSNPPYSAHHFRYFDLEITWQARKTGSGVRICGTIHNLRAYYLQDLELNARLLNQSGRVVARGSSADFPNYVDPGRSVPFDLEFPLAPGSEADRVHFGYLYWLVEAAPEFRSEDDVPHFGAFTAPL